MSHHPIVAVSSYRSCSVGKSEATVVNAKGVSGAITGGNDSASLVVRDDS